MSIPAIILSLLFLEALARFTWDEKRGVPGFRMQHAKRGYSLSPNYRGYYAGQPARINNLGFRDDKDYAVEKGPNVFRILVLGDSVTYGYGVKFKETWAYQFQKRLEKWKPDTKWQVWNMGVPAYEMDAELRTLEDIGPKYKPDLVIVGFYENDLGAPTYGYQPAWRTKLKNFFRHNFYLFYHFRNFYHIFKSKYVLGMTPGVFFQTQYLYKPMVEPPSFDKTKFVFKHGLKNSPLPPRTTREFKPKKSSTNIESIIAKFQKYHNEGTYKIVFFINIAPDHDHEWNRKEFIGPIRPHFYEGIHNEMNNWFMKIMGKGTPVLSSYDAFWSYKVSEVPGAWHHSLGAANMVKADILFKFISNNVIKDKFRPEPKLKKQS